MAVPICHFNSISLSFCLFICLCVDLCGTDYFIWDRQPTGRQPTNRQTDRHTGWQTERLTERTGCSQADTGGQKGRQPTDWHRQTDQQTDRETDKPTDWKRQQAGWRFYLWYITYTYWTVSDAGVFALDRLWTRGR